MPSLASAAGQQEIRQALTCKSLLGEGPLTFDELLSNRSSLLYFKRFCVQELSSEYLLFWLEASDYRAIKTQEYRSFLAKKMLRKYICPDSPMMLGIISGRERDSITKAVESGSASEDMFDAVTAQVYFSLRYDIFPRFVASNAYQKLVDMKLEDVCAAQISDFDLYRFLGAGGFGMVLLQRHRANKKFYAVKVIDKRIIISQNQIHAIFREKEVLACVEHPFVVALRYAFQTPDHLCLVLEFVAGGNMYVDLMKGPYEHARAVHYAAQVVLALEHLHSLQILYRDLKPDNVLLAQDGTIKLADMGAARGLADDGCISNDQSISSSKTAKTVDAGRPRRMTITGTHGYRSPEVYDRSYGKPADWWNVGLLIIEMLTCNNPLRGENRKASEYLTKYKELALPSSMNDDAQSIAHAFLSREAKRRLGTVRDGEAEQDAMNRVRGHRFFAGVDFEKLLAGEVPPPFECHIELSSTLPQRQLTAETNQLDYFCQMVDYMKTSMEMRSSWLLTPEDQRIFEDFDFVSTRVFEDDQEQADRPLDD